jgi:hypothetical protein
MEQAPPAVQSWSRYFIYQGAEEVLSLPREDRAKALDKIPLTIRPYVEAEILRLWNYARSSRSAS